MFYLNSDWDTEIKSWIWGVILTLLVICLLISGIVYQIKWIAFQKDFEIQVESYRQAQKIDTIDGKIVKITLKKVKGHKVVYRINAIDKTGHSFSTYMWQYFYIERKFNISYLSFNCLY